MHADNRRDGGALVPQWTLGLPGQVGLAPAGNRRQPQGIGNNMAHPAHVPKGPNDTAHLRMVAREYVLQQPQAIGEMACSSVG
jgi:hypothetical protein